MSEIQSLVNPVASYSIGFNAMCQNGIGETYPHDKKGRAPVFGPMTDRDVEKAIADYEAIVKKHSPMLQPDY